ncbi:aldehyde dehydrogenase family protein, partial [Acinetobacter baumannii]|uniref:aldehyde dehydrogenase family protein n=1 Tax=Acinetobacter baumannii TaxID=470 RepID=UPI00312C9288
AERIAFGKSLNAGQTCVAPDYVLVPSRRVEEFVSQYKEVVQGFFPRLSDNPDYTAIINERQLGRLRGYLDDAREKGATLVPLFAEGQQRRLPQTLLLNVSDDMKVMQEEIFGPVLACLEVESLEEAIALVNANPYGNGTSLFTRSGGAARRYQHAVQVGQVGINVPIPVPLPFFSFTGWKGSFYGDLHAYGKQAVRFYTETKTVTSRWFDDEPTTDESSAGPNMTIHLK